MLCCNQVLTNRESIIIQEDLLPCDYKKTYSRMILCVHQVPNAFSIAIWTADTDVLVLATAARCDNEHMWVSFSVGFSHKVSDASILKTTISYLKVLAVPVFHSYTGCDKVLLFKSIEKKDSLATVELT